MKLVCSVSDLNTHLSLVSRAVPARPNHPVLGNVLFHADAEAQQVKLTAFDLSLGIRTSFAAQVESDAKLTLPAKLFHEIVAKLPPGDLTIEATLSETPPSEGSETATAATAEDDGEENSHSEAAESAATTAIATLFSVSGRYQVRGMDAEEFPELPAIENGSTAQISAKALLEGLRGSLFAASTDETKQVLTGIHLVVGEDGLEFAATDGHRLAVVETTNELEKDGELQPLEADAFEVTIPTRAWRELERAIALHDRDRPIQLYFDPGQAIFELDNRRLTTRTLEGQYPAYRQLIPDRFSRQISVDRKQLLQALELVSVLADRKNSVVKFSLDAEANQLSLSADAQDIGSGTESLDADISGDSIDVAFNVKYLMESLKNLQSSQIQIQLNTATSPAILQPLGGIKMTHLIMPVQLRS
ncbi:DNA polymerase III subunit beta [Geitlerinema sp. PCC 9228]|uniref:DNA polymerase III subunit beta n=1 Tax=Geitlerinema sp. PCC 9228 TaxID=111611 RepID=UPI0008F994C9|nr:DNA polymerase III subunit beta [Geitlerinema sp. PCC 9228]